MYRHILVPIDSFDDAKTLVAKAASLAAEYGNCSITLMNVQMPVYETAASPHMAAPVVTVAVEHSLEQEAKDVLRQASKWLKQRGIAYQTVLKRGQPAAEICRYAKHADVDLVMVGKRDKSFIEKLLVGSVSQKVVANAPTNVLVVK